jgi:hypothetical protein
MKGKETGLRYSFSWVSSTILLWYHCFIQLQQLPVFIDMHFQAGGIVIYLPLPVPHPSDESYIKVKQTTEIGG